MFLSNPGALHGGRLRLFENEVAERIKGKSILLLGSAPSVVKVEADFMQSFDLIVRVNNYAHFNACQRTDIYYSMLGGSILKSMGDLINDGCQFVFCKNPFAKIQGIDIKDSLDMRRNYARLRKHWFELPFFLQTVKNWRWLNGKIGQVATTGLSALVDLYRYEPRCLHMAGFDFFSSKKHNINIPCNFKPWPKHHDFLAEMLFARKFVGIYKNITVDDTIKGIFAAPEKFPKIGNKP